MFLLLATFVNETWFGVILWLMFFIAALAIELSTEQLVSVWFCGGAVVAVILAACGVSLLVQGIVFVTVSAGLVALSKTTFAKKLINRDQKTNYDAIVGEKVVITEAVKPDAPGAAKVRDVVWTVAADKDIAVGEYAVVKEIRGNKLIVEKEEK